MKHLEFEPVGKLRVETQGCEVWQLPIPSPSRTSDKRRRRYIITITSFILRLILVLVLLLRTHKTIRSLQLVDGWDKATLGLHQEKGQNSEIPGRLERIRMESQGAQAPQFQFNDS